MAPERQASLFLAHGSPLLALDVEGYGAALREWAAARPKPEAVLVVSAHWLSEGPIQVGGHPGPPTIHDFQGFPEKLQRIPYRCPGSPRWAEEVVRQLQSSGFGAEIDPNRGLDHGAWVPLLHLYPDAKVPVVPLSLPSGVGPQRLLRLGRALAPLRELGLLLIGSGGLVHNLSKIRVEPDDAPVEKWAEHFDNWVWARFNEGNVTDLCSYRTVAPGGPVAVPTPEHFDPLFVVIGAFLEGDHQYGVYEGWQHGNLSLRSFALE